MLPLAQGDALPAGVLPADLVEGECVRDAQGAEIGSIEDVVVDVSLGRAVDVVIALSTGRQLTVPWSALAPDPLGGFRLEDGAAAR